MFLTYVSLLVIFLLFSAQLTRIVVPISFVACFPTAKTARSWEECVAVTPTAALRIPQLVSGYAAGKSTDLVRRQFL